jgi:hypothetical protein
MTSGIECIYQRFPELSELPGISPASRPPDDKPGEIPDNPPPPDAEAQRRTAGEVEP